MAGDLKKAHAAEIDKQKFEVEKLREIGEIMKMDYSAVSGLARRFEKEMKTDKTSRCLAERLAKEVMKRRIRKD